MANSHKPFSSALSLFSSVSSPRVAEALAEAQAPAKADPFSAVKEINVL
jgi:hypothetical protein